MSIINTDKNILMIRCDCHSHVLEISSDNNSSVGIIPSFYFTVWNQSPAPFNFRDRLRLIWQLIRGKNLEGGDVIVSLNDADVISKFLADKVIENRSQHEKRRQKHVKQKKS